MCGIAGIIDPGAPGPERLAGVERMCAAMAHRGPDDSGAESFDDAAIGMRRLAIFDPANGHQPMRTPDGRFSIVFNGSIINHRDLRNELAGHWTFRTQCDTEALLAAYAHWGEDCLGRLRGMFAFAVWDSRDRTLFLARDPFGIKPLYYKHEGSRLVFASEIKGLLPAVRGGARIDPLAVADYLAWFAVPAPRTIFTGIFSLRPGECASFRNGQLDIRSAWSFRSIGSSLGTKPRGEDFSRELRSRLEETIRAHTLADVPVGVFLSGGLDSAAIAGLMTRSSGERLRTFTIGFHEPGFSEAAEAEATARHFGADHHTRILSGREVAGGVEEFIAACDQPTGDGLNTYYVSRTAREGGATVALSGLGGDELFGGYPSFRNVPPLARWLPRWRSLPQGVRRMVVSRMRGGNTRMGKLADVLSYARDPHELCALQRRVFSEPHRRSLLGAAPLLAVEGETPFHPELSLLRADLGRSGLLEIVSAWELRTYMADVLLRDSDIMSMRHALELRVPFVDRPFIEWLWSQNAADKFTPDHPKDALASAVADILPPALLQRRKRGFSLPMAAWMRRDLKPFLDETFSDSSVGQSGLFERTAVQDSWRMFLDHDDHRNWSRAWSLALLIAFVNRRAPDPVIPERRTVALAPRPAPEPAPAPEPVEVSDKPAGRTAPAVDKPADPGRSLPRRPPAPGPAQKESYRGHTLLLAPEIFSSVGGIPRILQLYLKALCDLDGAEHRGVRLLALNDPALDSSDVRRYAADNLDDWFVCNRRKSRFTREALRMSRGCDRLVCGHVGQLPVAWLARRFNPRLRYYLVAHGIEIWRSFSLIERIALRGAAGIFCVSDYTRRELLRNCPLPEGRAVVVPNALDPFFEIRPGPPPSQTPPVILTVARLTYEDRYKGIDHLIAALPAIRAAEPGACLHIVGHGDDLPRLQAQARREGVLRAGVEFLGFLDDKRMAAEMASCRLFALPSRKEGFGLVFLEAMARGRPCLGANAGGIPEVITEDTGVLVEFGDVPGIARACVAALRRDWDQDAILGRARSFSYGPFKERLAGCLARNGADKP